MIRRRLLPGLQALLAAALFGASAPLAKVLLANSEPILLASLLYLGAGFGLLAWKGLERLTRTRLDAEAALTKGDVGWLAGAVLAGGVAAPITLLFSLRATPAATAASAAQLRGRCDHPDRRHCI